MANTDADTSLPCTLSQLHKYHFAHCPVHPNVLNGKVQLANSLFSLVWFLHSEPVCHLACLKSPPLPPTPPPAPSSCFAWMETALHSQGHTLWVEARVTPCIHKELSPLLHTAEQHSLSPSLTVWLSLLFLLYFFFLSALMRLAHEGHIEVKGLMQRDSENTGRSWTASSANNPVDPCDLVSIFHLGK